MLFCGRAASPWGLVRVVAAVLFVLWCGAGVARAQAGSKKPADVLDAPPPAPPLTEQAEKEEGTPPAKPAKPSKESAPAASPGQGASRGKEPAAPANADASPVSESSRPAAVSGKAKAGAAAGNAGTAAESGKLAGTTAGSAGTAAGSGKGKLDVASGESRAASGGAAAVSGKSKADAANGRSRAAAGDAAGAPAAVSGKGKADNASGQSRTAPGGAAVAPAAASGNGKTPDAGAPAAAGSKGKAVGMSPAVAGSGKGGDAAPAAVSSDSETAAATQLEEPGQAPPPPPAVDGDFAGPGAVAAGEADDTTPQDDFAAEAQEYVRPEKREYSVRIDLLNWLLLGRLSVELEMSVWKYLTVSLTPVFVVAHSPIAINYAGLDDGLTQRSHGIGPLSGVSLGVGAWFWGEPFKGYVVRLEFTNYSYSYRTADDAGPIDRVDFTERRLLLFIGSHSRFGAFTFAGGFGLGYELNQQTRCGLHYDGDSVSARSDDCKGKQQIALDRSNQERANLNGPLHPVYFQARFSIGVVF